MVEGLILIDLSFERSELNWVGAQVWFVSNSEGRFESFGLGRKKDSFESVRSVDSKALNLKERRSRVASENRFEDFGSEGKMGLSQFISNSEG